MVQHRGLEIKGVHKPNCLLGLNPKGRVNPGKDAPNFINGAMMHSTNPHSGVNLSVSLRRAENDGYLRVSLSFDGHDILTAQTSDFLFIMFIRGPTFNPVQSRAHKNGQPIPLF